MRRTLILTLMAFLASSAMAADPPTVPATASKPADLAVVTVTGPVPPDAIDDPVVCRSSPNTGSRLRPAKVCRKRSEWAANSNSRGRAGDDFKMIGCDSGGTNCGASDRPPGN